MIGRTQLPRLYVNAQSTALHPVKTRFGCPSVRALPVRSTGGTRGAEPSSVCGYWRSPRLVRIRTAISLRMAGSRNGPTVKDQPMRRSLALPLVALIASCGIAKGSSPDDLPQPGKYRWEKSSIFPDGIVEAGSSGTRHEQFTDTQALAERILNPADNCHDVSSTIANATILITASCRLMNIEIPMTIRGSYGRNFWKYRQVLDGPGGPLTTDYSHVRSGA